MREWHFLGPGIPVKQLRSGMKGMGVERERVGWGGGGPESSFHVRSAPDLSHSSKMLGKMPLRKKAHEKSLTSKSKV
jgi:hypothetical protein